ncbi:non-ribosomal peptide synthetase component F, partial [Lysobacter enzymogenes]|uniref:AMP-binding protein n=1 Tax=Lysobacter enzymogenes TaxID=69 RepID=UPI0033950D48
MNTALSFALSAPQLEMWFAQELSPDNPYYDTRCYVDLRGPLDIERLRRALRATVSETDTLQLRFESGADGPSQRFAQAPELALAVVDLSAEADPVAAAQDWMRAATASAIDLDGETLGASAVLILGPQRHFWYQRYHHAIMDGYSVSLLTARAAELYDAYGRGETPPPARFGSVLEVIGEDRAYRGSERFGKDAEYWRRALDGAGERIGLDGRAPAASMGFHRASLPVDAQLTQALLEGERRSGTKWPQLLTSAAAAYCHRVAGRERMLFDFPVANRAKSNRDTPAMLANVLPLPLDFPAGASLTDIAAAAGREIGKTLRHQSYRGKDILQSLGDGGQQWIFGPRINIIPFDFGFSFDGHPAVLHSLSNGPVNDVAITLQGRLGDRGCELHFDVNRELYSAADAQNHLRRLVAFALRAVAAPERPIREIALLEAAERDRVLGEWNGAARFDERLTLPDWFEQQVERSPDAIALSFEDRHLSYAELNRRANRLAHRLIAAGVGPEDIVALALPREPDLVVAVLATLKAGAAYLPLDPDYPADRLAYMLGDAKPVALIADPSLTLNLPAGLPTLRVDDRSAAEHNPSDADRRRPLRPQHPAYVIYTSGSTGQPKGVLVPHHNVVRLFDATGQFGFGPDDVWTLFHSYAFDFSVWELWGPLCHGGRLVIVPYFVSRAPRETLQLLVRERVTVLNQTPSAFYQLLQAEGEDPELGRQLSLRYVVFGGEALDFRP